MQKEQNQPNQLRNLKDRRPGTIANTTEWDGMTIIQKLAINTQLQLDLINQLLKVELPKTVATVQNCNQINQKPAQSVKNVEMVQNEEESHIASPVAIRHDMKKVIDILGV